MMYTGTAAACRRSGTVPWRPNPFSLNVLVLGFWKIVRQNNRKGFACKSANPFLLPDKLEFYFLITTFPSESRSGVIPPA